MLSANADWGFFEYEIVKKTFLNKKPQYYS